MLILPAKTPDPRPKILDPGWKSLDPDRKNHHPFS
jgi:hypothetical protein